MFSKSPRKSLEKSAKSKKKISFSLTFREIDSANCL